MKTSSATIPTVQSITNRLTQLWLPVSRGLLFLTGMLAIVLLGAVFVDGTIRLLFELIK